MKNNLNARSLVMQEKNETSRVCLFVPVCFVLLVAVCSAAAFGDGYAIPENCEWSDKIKESAGKEFICPADQVLTGRKHNGDENGNTKYYCCDAVLTSGAATREEGEWSDKIKESDGVKYECPANTVMAGRKHNGDENGNTKYYCAPLYKDGDPLAVDFETCEWSNKKKESDSDYKCKDDRFMVGRKHSGDENGNTKYYCCNVAE
ncbi:MAG: hypothetical protein GY953_49060 [bacterium]|nr:hypothetical protein [bacterium]